MSNGRQLLRERTVHLRVCRECNGTIGIESMENVHIVSDVLYCKTAQLKPWVVLEGTVSAGELEYAVSHDSCASGFATGRWRISHRGVLRMVGLFRF